MSDLSATLGDALSNPNVQNYLHMISSAEGTAQADNPYAVAFGGGNIDDLSAHPGVSHTFTQTDGKQNTTSAAGAYQFEKGTWSDIQKALNLSDFGPRSQDLGALYLMNKSGSLQDVLKGDYSAAIQKDGKTWASLPSSTAAQNHRSQLFVDQALGQSGSGGPISNANAADAPGADSGDLSTVPAPKLLDAYQRAQAAQDPEAMQQISAALTPRLQQGLKAAQDHNDADAVNQLQGMLGTLGANPQGSAAPQQPTQDPNAAPGNPGSTQAGPPVSAKNPTTLQALGKFGAALVDHPSQVLSNIGTSLKNGAEELGNSFVEHPVDTALNVLHGVGDTVTLGFGDKLGALLGSKVNGMSYEDQLLRMKQQEQANGTPFAAGQLAGALVPVSAPIAAARTVPAASKVARVAAGAAAGGAEGAANYLGHNTGPVDAGDLVTNAGLGAALGTLPGFTTGATQGQKAATFLRQAGGDVAGAQRDAEIVQGLQGLADRSTQGAAKLGPADANALATGYTQRAADAVRQLDKTPENRALITAMDRSRGLNDDQIAALRVSPEGNAVADAIQMRQRALAMTSPTPATSGILPQALRMAADNFIPVAPVRHLALSLLGGRENRTANIGSALAQGDNAAAFLSKYGPSQASQSAQQLAQMGQGAVAARQAALQAAQAAQASRQAQGFIQRGQAAAAAQRNAAVAAQAQGQQVFLAGRQAALQARTQNAAQQAQAAAQARSVMGNAVQGGAQLRAQAAQAAAPAQQELLAAAQAKQAAQAAAAKDALKLQQQQKAALAETQASDPTYLLGMSNPNGAPRNPQEMSEFSKVIRQQMEASQETKAAQAAQAAETQSKVSKVAAGDFSGLDINKPQAQALLSYVDHPDLPAVQRTMSAIAAQDPEAGQKIVQLLTPGSKNLSKQDFYGLQARLQQVHGAKVPLQMGVPAAAQPEGALSSAIQNPVAYKAQVLRNQAAVSHAASVAPSPAMAAVAHQMGMTSSPELKQQAFEAVLAKATPAEKEFLKKHVEPLIRYGK